MAVTRKGSEVSPRRKVLRPEWHTEQAASGGADSLTGNQTAGERARVNVLAELLRTLPMDAKQKIRDDVAGYLREQGQVEQLALLLSEESEIQHSESTRPVQYPAVSRYRSGRGLIAFGWYGGKFSHLSWLLPLLPSAHHYCEPFGGSAAVLLNRTPSPVETYNDIYGEVANFFRVLRDQTDAVVKAIALTPFSREEFANSLDYDPTKITDIERARRFFVRARQVRTGLAQTASIGRWANCKKTSRAGMAGVVSRWIGSVDALPDIAVRLLRVQIENRPAADVIKLYDSSDTLFYCDPPYPHESRGDSKAYKFEMTTEEHTSLAQVLGTVKGKAAISGYRCELMDRLYAGWRCVEADEKICHSVKQPRTEALWMNY